MKLILVVILATGLSSGLCFGQQARKIAPSKPVKATAIVRVPAKAAPAKAAPIRSAVVAKTSYRAPATKAARVPPVNSRFRRVAPRAPVRIAYFQSPTADRYREIQQALADKGYLTTEVNGAWDQAAIEALNRFKTEQKLKADGKICSLSLIALGLGPKYEAINVDQLSANPIPADQQ